MRQRDDGGPLDAEVVEEESVGVSLVVERRAFMEGGPQIAETRRRDPVKPVAKHSPRQQLTLIEAAAAAMNDEDRGSDAPLGVLDVAIG